MLLQFVLQVQFLYTFSILQLKDENGKLLGVDASNLLIANSGNDLPVRSSVLFLSDLLQFFLCLDCSTYVSMCSSQNRLLILQEYHKNLPT